MRRLILPVLLSLMPLTTLAYIPIRSPSTGAVVKWPSNSNLIIRTNDSNRSGLSSSDIFSIFTTTLNRWKQAASGGLDFTYYQGNDPNLYPNSNGVGADNNIFFASSNPSAGAISCGVIAVTQVYFDQGSGQVSRFDMRYNDNCFTFSNIPSITGVSNYVYLGDVATHEIGHGLGLDHSQNLQSSMIYTAFIGMSKPACDDTAAVTSTYAPGSVSGHAGSVTGRVLTPGGAPVFGAHVNAISHEHGASLASAISDKDGSFSIHGLEAGSYSLMIEPYYPGASALGPYYASVNPNVCSGTRFERTFIRDGQILKKYNVVQSGTTDAGNLAVSCSAPSSIYSGAETSTVTAPVITNTPLTASSVSIQSTFGMGSSHYYKLTNQVGTVRVSALSYSIFSIADVEVDILNSSGSPIASQKITNAFNAPTSGYVNYDASASVTLASQQDIYVKVTYMNTLATNKYPSGSTGVSTIPYYVITVASSAPTDPIYASNARCEATDNFGSYPNQGSAPPLKFQNSGSSISSNASKSGGACGMITRADRESDPNGFFNRTLEFALTVIALYYARRILTAQNASLRI